MREEPLFVQQLENQYPFWKQISDGILVFSSQLTYIQVNKIGADMLGMSPSQLIGKTIRELAGSQAEIMDPYVQEVMERGESMSAIHEFLVNGNLQFYDCIYNPILSNTGNLVAVTVVCRNVTAREYEKSSLKEVLNDQYLKHIKNLQNLVFRLKKRNGKIVFLFSEGIIAQVLRITTDRVIGKSAKEVFRPDIAHLMEQNYQKAFLGKVVYFELNLSGLIFNTTLSPIMKDGKVVEVFGLVTDITKRKRVEKKLKESEERYQLLVELSPEPIAVISEGKLFYINPAGVKLLGANHKDDLLGTDILEYVHPSYHQQLKIRNKRMFETGYMEIMECKVITLDGRVMDVEVTGISITYMDKPAMLTITRDVTEKRKTEELLRKSEKLAIAGQLAAGVAHEVRNPLTSIKGFLQFMKPHAEEKHYYDIILSELDRIETIIREFLIFAKPQIVKYRKNNVYTLLKDTVTLLQPQMSLTNIEVYIDLNPGLPLIPCEENQMKQVFINILKNAMEAMPDGGRIKIQVQHEMKHISIRFIDEGCGIPEGRLVKLGEPFYTMKEKGTGLGLMICFKIIENHQGKIQIYSQEGKGTTVEILLPISKSIHDEGRVSNVCISN